MDMAFRATRGEDILCDRPREQDRGEPFGKCRGLRRRDPIEIHILQRIVPHIPTGTHRSDTNRNGQQHDVPVPGGDGVTRLPKRRGAVTLGPRLWCPSGQFGYLRVRTGWRQSETKFKPQREIVAPPSLLSDDNGGCETKKHVFDGIDGVRRHPADRRRENVIRSQAQT